MNSAGWTTWELGKELKPGDDGIFNEQRQFLPTRSLKSVGISGSRYSNERPIGARFYRSKSGTGLVPKVSGQSSAAFDLLGKADAGVRIIAESSHACVLHVLDATEKVITNHEQVMDEVLAHQLGA